MLAVDPERPLADQYVQLRDLPARFGPLARRLIDARPPVFRDVEVMGGSIGTGMARLWKGEVGATVLRPIHETPWDLAPIAGISQRLGFRFFLLTGDRLEPWEPHIGREVRWREDDLLVVHRSRVDELAAAVT